MSLSLNQVDCCSGVTLSLYRSLVLSVHLCDGSIIFDNTKRQPPFSIVSYHMSVGFSSTSPLLLFLIHR